MEKSLENTPDAAADSLFEHRDSAVEPANMANQPHPLALAEIEGRARARADGGEGLHYLAALHADGSTTLRWASDSYGTLTGFSCEELRASWGGLVVPEDRAALREHSRRVAAGRTAFADYRVRTVRGDVRWVRDCATPIRDGDRIVGLLGAAMDVTDAESAERRIRDSEALHRQLAENASDLITLVDARGVITYVSPSVRHLLGYQPEELVGRPFRDISHPDERDDRSADLADLASTSRDARPVLVYRVRRKDGRYVHLESTNTTLRDEHGEFSALLSVTRDVTARIEAEQALERAEDSFRALITALPDPAVVHRDGRIVHANPSMVSLLGWERAEDLVGRDVRSLIHPEDRSLVDRRVAAAPARSRVAEHRIVGRDGQPIDAQVSSIPILFERSVARVAIAQDRRERRRIEAELARAERLASLGRLASAVGHEINNPLTYVLVTLQQLDAAIDDQAVRARIAAVREGAERVRDIVRDLRALSATELDSDADAGSDLRRVIQLAASTAGHEIRHRARLVIELGPFTSVAGSEGRLVQVFVNLLVNAAQSIPDGNVEENEIRVTSRRVGANVEIEVHDTGCGVPEGDAPRIFDAFFTTKPASVGTGLGLAIVQRIVTGLGGSITAHSRVPRGSTFRVTLPLRATAEPAPTARRQRQPERPARVLFVDDEPHIGRIVTAILAPHDAVVVTSGRQAIELLGRDRAFDAIVCDLQMKDLGGVDVYEWLATNRPELTGRIGFITGGVFTERASAFLQNTNRPCLDKPFDADALCELVERLITPGLVE